MGQTETDIKTGKTDRQTDDRWTDRQKDTEKQR